MRIARAEGGVPRQGDTLIMQKRGGGERLIPSNKWWLNRNTPVGEPADLWERTPHDGRRLLDWGKLIGVLRISK